jgi:hypothetical protein
MKTGHVLMAAVTALALGELLTHTSLPDIAAAVTAALDNVGAFNWARSQWQPASAPAQPASAPAQFKQPTATELWNLQGECAKLAQKKLDWLQPSTPSPRPSWRYIVESRYRADEGRCYVVEPRDLSPWYRSSKIMPDSLAPLEQVVHVIVRMVASMSSVCPGTSISN